MPKIAAATVAEHRAAKEREILDAARSLLDDGEADAATIGSLARRVGLSRSAIYKYFGSFDEICWRIIEDSFADWTKEVSDKVFNATTPGEAIKTYVHASLALAIGGAHRVAMEAGRISPSHDRTKRLNTLHETLRSPLSASLAELGTNNEALVATLIDAMLGRAIELIDAGGNAREITTVTSELVGRAVGINSEGTQL